MKENSLLIAHGTVWSFIYNIRQWTIHPIYLNFLKPIVDSQNRFLHFVTWISFLCSASRQKDTKTEFVSYRQEKRAKKINENRIACKLSTINPATKFEKIVLFSNYEIKILYQRIDFLFFFLLAKESFRNIKFQIAKIRMTFKKNGKEIQAMK